METTYSKNGYNKTGRFTMVARKLFIEQRKTLLILTGSYLGACMLFGLWFGYLGAAPNIQNMLFYIMLSGLACALVASKMFFDMTSKQGRTALLMTPAKACDKFLTRFVGVLPGMLLLVALGYLVYGYSDILALGLISNTWMHLFNPFENVANDTGTTAAICAIFSIFLFNESIFMFGSVAWPKRSFLKSLGVFAGIQILFFFIAAGLGKLIVEYNLRIEIVDQNALNWILIGCITLVAAIIMWCAYRKFKHTTII